MKEYTKKIATAIFNYVDGETKKYLANPSKIILNMNKLTIEQRDNNTGNNEAEDEDYHNKELLNKYFDSSSDEEEIYPHQKNNKKTITDTNENKSDQYLSANSMSSLMTLFVVSQNIGIIYDTTYKRTPKCIQKNDLNEDRNIDTNDNNNKNEKTDKNEKESSPSYEEALLYIYKHLPDAPTIIEHKLHIDKICNIIGKEKVISKEATYGLSLGGLTFECPTHMGTHMSFFEKIAKKITPAITEAITLQALYIKWIAKATARNAKQTMDKDQKRIYEIKDTIKDMLESRGIDTNDTLTIK
jgi:hypothetical protein